MQLRIASGWWLGCSRELQINVAVMWHASVPQYAPLTTDTTPAQSHLVATCKSQLLLLLLSRVAHKPLNMGRAHSTREETHGQVLPPSPTLNRRCLRDTPPNVLTKLAACAENNTYTAAGDGTITCLHCSLQATICHTQLTLTHATCNSSTADEVHSGRTHQGN